MSRPDLRGLFRTNSRDLVPVDVFTNRADEWSAVRSGFARVVADRRDTAFDAEDVQRPRRNVLAFYGVGGIGKTTLSRRIAEVLETPDNVPCLKHSSPERGRARRPDHRVPPLPPVQCALPRPDQKPRLHRYDRLRQLPEERALDYKMTRTPAGHEDPEHHSRGRENVARAEEVVEYLKQRLSAENLSAVFEFPLYEQPCGVDIEFPSGDGPHLEIIATTGEVRVLDPDDFDLPVTELGDYVVMRARGMPSKDARQVLNEDQRRTRWWRRRR